MAKRSPANTCLSSLLLIAIVAVIALGYVAPFVLIAVWAYTEYAARRGVDGNVEAGFEYAEERASLRDEINLASARIEQLDLEGSGQNVTRRSGGMFDARYRKGRELNALIETEAEALAFAQAQLAGLVEPLARRDGMRLALISYFGVLFFLWVGSWEISTFMMSVSSSIVAIFVGLATYATRKQFYVESL